MLRSKQKPKPQETGFILFDVYYEDGSRRSNRRVPRAALNGLDGDAPARQIIEEQGSGDRREVRPSAARHRQAGAVGDLTRRKAAPRRPPGGCRTIPGGPGPVALRS
ncbi:hypothetical protein Mnod_0684 [Methylobacterium nodulans ORS 2060]|uniref:Uncharacterized protein n=1 Tax=Methylobacterium nodulans (strain LMG 21967 / CNCM I-2342 / ORS 2060) TaxID=460265 RepID=B8IF05_METNO|nr:hypothetical protein Mnod_0684 [Methylobacterium nodulans ORS 2060]